MFLARDWSKGQAQREGMVCPLTLNVVRLSSFEKGQGMDQEVMRCASC